MTIDTLASNYGWTKDYIETRIYPDDLEYLTKYIQHRMYGGYLMEAYIAQNPHVKKPKALIDMFRKMAGGIDIEKDEFDRVKFQKLKNQLKRTSKNITIK